MTAAIFTGLALFALVALYGLHVWREVRMAQRQTDPAFVSLHQRTVDALERSTGLMEQVAHLGPRPTWKPKLEVDNDPTGGDAA